MEAAATLDYSRVHLVDYDQPSENLFFRGNMPTLANHTFALDTLTAYLRARATESEVPFPSNFLLRVISLNNDLDGADFKAERLFWKTTSPQVGELVNWPLGLAGILPPSAFPKAEVGPLSNGSVWDVDKIPERIRTIRLWLTTKADKAAVLYVHCTAGCDRTGEVVGSYRMRYQPYKGLAGTDVVTMYAEDVAECGRPPNYWSTSALEWFCEYVAFNNVGAGTVGVGNCTGFAKCRFAGDCEPTHNRTV